MAEETQFAPVGGISWLPSGYRAEPLGNGKYRIHSEKWLRGETKEVDTKAEGFSVFNTKKFFSDRATKIRKMKMRKEGLRSELDAPTLDQFKAAGLPPELRANYYAKQMGISRDKLRKSPEGRYGYIAEDGKFAAFEGHRGLDMLTGAVPLALEAGGAIAGGLGGSAAGPVGTVAGSMAGAAGGSALGMEISEQLTGEDIPLGEEVVRAGSAALLDVGGLGIGKLIGKLGKFMSKTDLDRVAKEYGELVDNGMDKVLAQDKMLEKVNRELGTDLKFTPEERLAATPGGGAVAVPDQAYRGGMRDFGPQTARAYEQRAAQATDAYGSLVAKQFPRASGRTARKSGKEAVATARKAIVQGDEGLRQQAKAAFNEAFSETPYIKTDVVDESLALLKGHRGTRSDAGALANELQLARKTYGQGEDAVSFDFAKFESIHDNIKGLFDDAIKKADAGSPTYAKLIQAKKLLDNELDAISPTYRQAKDLWGSLKQGQREAYDALNEMASTSPKRYSAIIKDIIEKRDPEEIKAAKILITKQPNGKRVWEDLTRNYINDLRNEVAKRQSKAGTRYTETDIKLPERFADAFLATHRQRGLRAALTKQQYEGLTNLSKVMKRWGKATSLRPEAVTEGTSGGVLQVVMRSAIHKPAVLRYYRTFDKIAESPELLEMLGKIDFRRKTLTNNVQLVRRVLSSALLEQAEGTNTGKQLRQSIPRAVQQGTQGLLGEE